MKFKKCLLVCLIFQKLLIFSEAGGNLKRDPPSPRPRTPETSGGPRPQTSQAPVWPRPQTPQTPGGARPQTSQAPVWPRPQTPQTPGGPRPQTSQAPVWPRPQTPQTPGGPRPQTSQGPVWPRPQTPQTPGGPRPQTSQAPVWPRPQTPQTPGGPRPQTSQAPVWARPQTQEASGSLHQSVGLKAPKSTKIQSSIASAQTCVDTITSKRTVIASAENCFDYFKMGVFWSPGYAYKQLKTGKNIRVHKVGPSWVIHGLWPSMFDRKENPISTCSRADVYFRQYHLTTNKILGRLDSTWYTIFAKEYSDNTKFWEHEFKKHGRCASRSSVIGDDVKYFERTLELFDQLDIGNTLSNAKYKVGNNETLRKVVNIIEVRINATIYADYVSNTNTNENYLTELFICFDTDLRVMDCPNVRLTDHQLNIEVKLLEQLPKL